MKTMKFIAVLAALSLSVSAMCQNTVKNDAALEKKVFKEVRKEAKRLKKEGWVSTGEPLEEQLERCYKYMTERDDEGNPKYVTGMGLSIDESFAAARMQATEFARQELSERSVCLDVALLVEKLVAINLFTKKEKDVIMAMQGEVGNIHGSLKRIVTWTVMEAYRDLYNNKKEVLVRLAINSSDVKEMVKDGIREELERRGIKISAQTLEKLYKEVMP